MTDKSLAGTSPEDRAGLLRFGAAKPEECAVLIGADWPRLICGQPARWFVWCESADAGITHLGVFNPATVGTRMCDDHLRILHTEPRGIKNVEPVGGQIPVTVIDLDGVL